MRNEQAPDQPSDRADAYAEFFRSAGFLKGIKRTGWVDRDIPLEQVESVAAHSWRVALMAWLLAAEVDGIDRNRVLLLALLHDLAESVTGDLPPYDPDALPAPDDPERRQSFEHRQIMPEDRKRAKQAAEDAAILALIAELPEPVAADIASLWQEMSERSTPESRFVKEIDRLETFLQSREYLAEFPGLPVLSFLLEVLEELSTPVLQQVRDAIIPTPQDE
ncbi:MAG: HD domain-containing protein [Thermomicrobiales bacterium]|nr:HD domain-containing protein [Thermomicrobiales bacterium]